jgi:hypothetical protein
MEAGMSPTAVCIVGGLLAIAAMSCAVWEVSELTKNIDAAKKAIQVFRRAF